MRCAVVIPVGPGHELLAQDAQESVDAAFQADRGPFSEVATLCIADPEGRLGRSRARNQGVLAAHRDHVEWLFFLDADDLMHPAAFAVLRPYAERFDAVWGAICELSADEESGELRAGQVLEMRGIAEVLSFDPWLTLQMGHFVRTAVASANPFDERMDCGEDFDYYLRVWAKHRCIKVRQPLFLNRRHASSAGPRSATPAQWRVAAQAAIARSCVALGFHTEFEVAGEHFRFLVDNPFDTVQRSHLKRRFFEAEELDYLRERVPRGGVIVEVGANVGNHVVYYARFLAPRKIVVLEPNPAALDLLGRNLAANAVTCADLSQLGVAAGDHEGRYEARTQDDNNLGATRLVESPQGPIRCAPLDRLIAERVDFIKIDVEGMELQVLEGARELVRASRPLLLVEIFREQLAPFEKWMESNGYRVARTFDYVHAVNLFLQPR